MPAEPEETLGSATQELVVCGSATPCAVQRDPGAGDSSPLRHLEDVGFAGAPRALGVDEHGGEILSYLPSERVWPYSERVIVATARVLRRLHDALDTFTPAAGSVWRHEIDDAFYLRIGHNDIGPQNTVFAGGRAGVSPHSRYLARGEDRFLRYDLDSLVANRGELEKAIR